MTDPFLGPKSRKSVIFFEKFQLFRCHVGGVRGVSKIWKMVQMASNIPKVPQKSILGHSEQFRCPKSENARKQVQKFPAFSLLWNLNSPYRVNPGFVVERKREIFGLFSSIFTFRACKLLRMTQNRFLGYFWYVWSHFHHFSYFWDSAHPPHMASKKLDFFKKNARFSCLVRFRETTLRLVELRKRDVFGTFLAFLCKLLADYW